MDSKLHSIYKTGHKFKKSIKKSPLIDYMKKAKYDEFYTPRRAIMPLIPYLSKFKSAWECTDFGESEITKVLKENNINTISSHKKNGKSFFEFEPDSDSYDVIITNPPYSLKDRFLERAYDLKKPFAMLLPITALEGVNRNKLYREYGIQLLVLDKRMNFQPDKKSNWFNTSWFCYNVLPKDLIFHEVKND